MQFAPLVVLAGCVAGVVLRRADQAASEPVNVDTYPPYNFQAIPVSGGVPIINDINEYRQRAKLPLLAWDWHLVNNSYITAENNVWYHWEKFVHDLQPPSYAQVMTAGINDAGECGRNMKGWTPFQLSLLCWLCENPSDAAIRANCQQARAVSGCDPSLSDTEHWQILHSAAYHQIGCAYAHHDVPNSDCSGFNGAWVCDFSI